ncbi:MAG: DUF1573 domain-containing protein [Cyclobacteriaceae bacterium]|nr:DUF1573 domain-containing protein [Cyclobacteriaceae bacterium]
MKPGTFIRPIGALTIWIMCCAALPKTFAQSWSLMPEINNSPVYGIGAVPSPDEFSTPIYAVGSGGLIKKSIDGGQTWTSQSSGTTSTLRDVYFLDKFAGWAVGDGGVTLRTANEGVSWSSTLIPGAPTLHAITRRSFNDPLWAVGANGGIYKSTNEGVTWVAQTTNTTQDFHGVVAINSSLIIAVGTGGAICRSTNGGTTWTTTIVGANINLNAVHGHSTGSLIAVGSSGVIYRSYDSGQSWTAQFSGTSNSLFDVHSSVSGVYACGVQGTIVKTTNGQDWIANPTGSTDQLNAIAVRGNTMWIAGSKGNLKTTDIMGSCVSPSTIMLTSNLSVCAGQSISIDAVNLGNFGSRIWKKNGTALYVNTSFTIHPRVLTINNVQPTDAGTYLVELTGPCGTITSSSITVTVNVPQVPSTIVGPTGNVSQNALIPFSVSPIPGATFNWDPGAGGLVTGTGNSVQLSWNTTGLKFISVTATGACGTSIARTGSVQVISCALPVQPSVITKSSGSECTSSTASYSVTNVPGVTYAWAVSAGGTIVGSGNSANVTWNTTTGSRTITVTPSNSCGNGTARTLSVTVDPTPSQPSAITGSTAQCTGVSTAYSVTNVPGITYTWNTGGAGTITGSGNSINVTWNSAGAKVLTVTPSNACGTGIARTLAVTVNAAASQPSIIAGANAVQTGSASQYSITPESGVTYTWSSSPAGTITGSGSSVSISWPTSGSKTITVTPSNSCGNGTVRTLAVTVSDCAAPAQPSIISGSATSCIGSNGAYSVTSVGGVSYTWDAGANGIVSGSGNSVTLSWTTIGTKTITVTPFNACGAGTPRTLTVTVSQLPTQPSAISGSTTICKGTSDTYSVPNVGGVTYTWDTGGRGTVTGSGNSVSIQWTAIGANELRVTPSTACGNGTVRTVVVNVNETPLSASAITGSNFACTNVAGTYSVTNVTGVNYVWNAGSGGVVTGSGNSVSITWTTPGAKTIQLTPTNTCGSGSVRTLNVTVTAPPTQPSSITGNTSVNAGITNTYSVTNVPGVTYAWSASGGFIAGTGSSVQITWATAGTKTITVTPSDNCGNGSSRTFNVTVSVPCVIPGAPVSLDGPTAFNLNQIRRYTVGTSSGANSLSISVTPTTGITITPVSANQWDINFTSAGEFIVSAVGVVNGCDNGTGNGTATGPPATLPVSICAGSVATPTGLTGPTSGVCKFSKSRYSVNAIPGLVYEWVPLGSEGSFEYLNASKSEVEVTWTNPGAPSISVRGRDACNNFSGYASLSVTMAAAPANVSISTSPFPPYCDGANVTYTITNPQGGVTYSWDLKGPGTVAGNTLSATILATEAARTIEVFGSNSCFINSPVNSIGFGGGIPIPLQPGPVTGPSSINLNTNGTYAVAAQANGVFFSWSAGADATITAGASFNTKEIRWSTGGIKTISVQANNSCGIPAERTYTVVVNTPCVIPAAPTSVTRLHSGAICKDVAYAFSVPYIEGVTYNWSAGADATITGTSNERLIKWSANGSKDVIVSYTNACGTSATQQTSIAITPPPSSLSITGDNIVCNGTPVNFSVSNVGGIGFNWEAPGATITGQGNNSISINNWPNTGVNVVKFKPSNACGFGPETTLSVTVNAVPVQPSAIAGDLELCQNSSKVYSVDNVSGVTYTWDGGANSTITGSGNTRTISWSTTGSKNIQVTPSNSCGVGPARVLNPTVITIPAQPSIITGAASVSIGSTNAYSVTNINGVNYTWSLPDKGILSSSGNSASVFWNTSGSATLSVTPSNACGNGAARNQTITINKIAQNITFTLPSPALTTDEILFSGTTDAGLPLSYSSSDNTVGEVSGSQLIIKKNGTINITASQAGDNTFAAAIPVVRSLTINKAGQTITFDPLPNKTFGDGSFTLNAESTSALSLSYSSSNTSVATVSGNSVTIVGAGSTSITASQGGNAIFNAATPVVRALTVNKADQTISFEPLVAKGISDPPFSLSATASSGLTVSYTSSNTSVATVSGSTVTIVGQGTTTITASQAGNGNYNAASAVQQSLTINAKQGQTITFNSLPSKTFGDAAFSLSATASSNLPVTYASSNTAVATIAGNTVTILAAGSTTITASQGGDATYNPATSVQQTLVVNKANQTISFAALENRGLSQGGFTLQATSTSGLPITFTSSNTSVASLSGNSVTVHATGTTNIIASQNGNANYNAATSVIRSLTIVDDSNTRIISVSGNLDFGDVVIPNPLIKTMTITNSGNSALSISQITFQDGFTGDKNSETIQAGASLQVNITFLPTQAIDYTGIIAITSNSTAGTGTINVSGKGVVVTAVEDLTYNQPINVFPNPGKDIFILEAVELAGTEATVIDGVSRAAEKIDLIPIGLRKYQLNLSHLAAGVYYVQLPMQRSVKTIRLVKIN